MVRTCKGTKGIVEYNTVGTYGRTNCVRWNAILLRFYGTRDSGHEIGLPRAAAKRNDRYICFLEQRRLSQMESIFP